MSLLRFLHVRGFTPRSLAESVPGVAGWRETDDPADDAAGRHRGAAGRAAIARRLTARGIDAMLMLLARLGLRSIEIARLQLDDLDWRGGDLLVRGKARRDDRLPIPDDVGAALAEYLAFRGRHDSRSVFLTLRAPTRPIRADLVGDVVQRHCRQAGVPHVGPHRLRHTLATRMLAPGCGAGGHQPGAASQRSRDHRDLRKGRSRPAATGRPAVAGSGTMTVLEQHLDEYLQLRRTLGHKLADAHRLLPRFVTYLDDARRRVRDGRGGARVVVGA